MYANCLFCNAHLGANREIEHFPVGRKLAFDAEKGRLWVVCTTCGRWNLTPLEDRWEAIDECERRFRETFIRVSTDNVGLSRLSEGLELVRIGRPLRPEFAAWRYADNIGRRWRRTHVAAGAGIVAAAAAGVVLIPLLAPALTMGAISVVVIPGLTTVLGAVPVVGAVVARDYVQHERVVARLPYGRRVATVRAKHLSNADFSVRPDGEASLEVLHDRGWSRFEGTYAIHASGVILAGANRLGANGSMVQRAVSMIEDEGDAGGYLSAASRRTGWRGGKVFSLLNDFRGLGAMKLSPSERLAMEMSVHEEAERRALHGELRVLEDAWRDAERIAQICDEELT